MSKYRAVRTEVDGITFASKREAARYQELKILVRSGYITDLVLQPRFPIYLKDVKVCEYRADFAYKDKDGRQCVEDAKGMATQVYKLKKKLFEACYAPLRVLEV